MPASKKKVPPISGLRTPMVEKELGNAEAMTMDTGIREAVAMMFEHDNPELFMEVTLEDTEASVPPKILIRMELVSINGIEVNPST